MSIVFIGGSRRLSRLNDAIRARLDNIVERRHAVLVGDANGGDRAVQAYLAERGYGAVTVYCTNGTCRNNVGRWPIHTVTANGERGFDFFALKDAAMARDADCGFMLWDGSSQGTLSNVRRLIRAGKFVVVYLASRQTCVTLRSDADLATLEGTLEATRKAPSRGLLAPGARLPRQRSLPSHE